MSRLISRKIKNGFVLVRGISSLLALIFSLYYSRTLGVEKRSLVTLILVVTVTVMVALTAGVGLAFRKYTVIEPDLISLSAFLYTNLILAFLVSGISILALSLYSATHTSIPSTLLYLAAIYAFLGALDFNYHQGLIAYGMFKIGSILDLATISIQILIFFLLTLSNQVSIAASLFTSLIISYLTSVVSSTLVLLVHTNASITTSWKDIALLFKKSTPFHIVGIAGGFADRIDRLMIAWFLPLGFLGKYAVGTSILTYLRFLPEAFSRLIISGQGNFKLRRLKLISKSWLLRLLAGVFVSLVLAGLSQLLVLVALGKQWLISFAVIVGFSVQELMRGYFQLRVSTLVNENKEKLVTKVSLLLITLSTLLSFIGVKLAGLIGVPIGIAISYAILILLSHTNKVGLNK
jgi:O-antigen/teichoic acid export membrane protein